MVKLPQSSPQKLEGVVTCCHRFFHALETLTTILLSPRMMGSISQATPGLSASSSGSVGIEQEGDGDKDDVAG